MASTRLVIVLVIISSAEEVVFRLGLFLGFSVYHRKITQKVVDELLEAVYRARTKIN